MDWGSIRTNNIAFRYVSTDPGLVNSQVLKWQRGAKFRCTFLWDINLSYDVTWSKSRDNIDLRCKYKKYEFDLIWIDMPCHTFLLLFELSPFVYIFLIFRSVTGCIFFSFSDQLLVAFLVYILDQQTCILINSLS